MTKENDKITEENNYFSKRINSSIPKYKECLDLFSKNFEKEASLKTGTIIFVDTNVLLRYYSISFTAREKLLKFLTDNKERLVITPQVQIEFIKNREDIIQKFLEQVTTKIPKDFNTDIINKMKSFLDIHKVVLKDYPFIEPGIEKHKIELEQLLKKLTQEVELKKKEHIDLVIKDQLLNLLSSCKQSEQLSSDETNLVKKHFDILSKSIATENSDSFLNKPNAVFPGFGDIKIKPDEPYGDYIIFHEIMKHMIINNANAIFLTFDNTKGDWMHKNKTSHIHYFQNMYANTGKILYIIDAERSLEKMLNINIDSLVENTESKKIPITQESLLSFSENHRIYRGARIKEFSANVVLELKLNGYNFIHEIENVMNKMGYRMNRYLEIHPTLTNIGITRVALRIDNSNYTAEISNIDGTISNIASYKLKEYEYFRNLKMKRSSSSTETSE